MATIVSGTIPAEELALNHTLEALPDLKVECERIVKNGENISMRLLWFRDAEREAIDAALDEDETVVGVHCLSEFEDEFLYQMDWTGHVSLLLQMITNGQATILDAYGRNDCWQIRVLYPDREHLSRTHDFADEHELTFDVESVREMQGKPAGRFGLTDSQYRSLVEAVERGYYDVPRAVTLEELADQFDVSHQALSEQLRRGTGALIDDALVVGETD